MPRLAALTTTGRSVRTGSRAESFPQELASEQLPHIACGVTGQTKKTSSPVELVVEPNFFQMADAVVAIAAAAAFAAGVAIVGVVAAATVAAVIVGVALEIALEVADVAEVAGVVAVVAVVV